MYLLCLDHVAVTLYYEIAPAVVHPHLAESQFAESPAHIYGTELLADARSDNLKGTAGGHEYTMLLLGGMGEVERNEFPLQTGCLKLVVVKVELDDLLLRKPISEA